MMDLTELYQAVAAGKGPEYLEAHPDLLRDEVAKQARADVNEGMSSGRADLIIFAATAASLVQLALGRVEEGLTSRLDALQGFFAVAEEPDLYESTRGRALALGTDAADNGLPGLTFRCWVLAADCAWFASDSDPEKSPGRLIQAIRDVTSATEAMATEVTQSNQTFWVERLASLLAIVASTAMSKYWPPELRLEADSALRRLAAASDALPVVLTFEGVGGAEKASGVATVLANLEQEYGSGA